MKLHLKGISSLFDDSRYYPISGAADYRIIAPTTKGISGAGQSKHWRDPSDDLLLLVQLNNFADATPKSMRDVAISDNFWWS